MLMLLRVVYTGICTACGPYRSAWVYLIAEPPKSPSKPEIPKPCTNPQPTPDTPLSEVTVERVRRGLLVCMMAVRTSRPCRALRFRA